MIAEARRANAAFALFDASGAVARSGEAIAVVGDDALTVGPVTVSFLDADSLRAADYRIELGLWPSGRLELSQLGRRFETFAAELRRIRNQARVAGVLAHGVAMPETFSGALLADSRRCAADFLVFDTHVTVVPEDDDPWQVPLGAVTAVRFQPDPPAVLLETGAGLTTLGQLARRREECEAAIVERREAQRGLLAELTGQSGFSDGWGVARGEVRDFDALLERFTSADRTSCVHVLVAAATADPRLGFVQLLDPEPDVMPSPARLPEHWAAFLLVPVGTLTVLEILAGPAAATYVFRGAIDAVNRDLQALHFRRAPLALTAEQAQLTPDNSYRLALRRLQPLQRLRA
ncbi:MAG TPA: hypothetical protein VFN38_11025, partial [Gemmatimonadaceae bacterium]|nr:hypothetical protein [Gemmatimonadaceae bacterium]